MGAGAASKISLRRAALAHEAVAHLSQQCPRLASMIERIGPHRPIISRDPFRTLVGSIVQQQISMSAAAAIQSRLVDALPGKKVSPEGLLSLRTPRLRKLGLSRQKAAYLRDLAAHFADGRLSAARLRRMGDEEVIEATTQVNGIGRWTAEMLLIFCLERPDVWPVDDLGIRKAVRNYLGEPEMPDKKRLDAIAAPWRPFRSYASWYLWRSLEGPLMPGVAVQRASS